ncbi:glycosyltransferase [candidate division KSB1 bacterium]|nr:glycosyltransferase [candidate division KSB1 bacterium]
MSAAPPRVSVIIASYKQKHYILNALRSVYGQTCDFDFEVIVVDSSGDDTAEIVEHIYPQTTVIVLKQRSYPGTARNYGIKQAKGEILAFTDTDCIVDQHWLQELVKSHELGYAVVGGLVKNGTPYSMMGTLDYLMEFSELITPHATTRKDHFATCNVSFVRAIVDQYGLFADQVKGSDNLYFRRIHAQGQVLYWQPSAVIWHRNRTRWAKILRNQYDLGVGAAMTRRKFNVKGKVFTRYPVLIPMIPFVRTLTIGGRLLRNSPINFIKFIVLLPLVLVCLTRYSVGFCHGLKK